MGRPFVRSGKVFRYVYKGGKKSARFLIRVYDLRASDFKKGTRRYFAMRRFYRKHGMLEEFEEMQRELFE